MLSPRVNLRSCRVQPWRSLCRSSQSRHHELNPASVLSFQRCQSTIAQAPAVNKPKNLSSASPEQRRRDLERNGWTSYPRPSGSGSPEQSIADIGRILKDFEHELAPGEASPTEELKVLGRILSVRTAGSKLLFADIYQHPGAEPGQNEELCPSIQIVVDKTSLAAQDDVSTNLVKGFAKLVQKGDFIAVVGNVYRTSSGQLSLRATQIPELLSPCLHQIPTEPLNNESDLAQDRHVHMLADRTWLKTIYARSRVIFAIREFMNTRGFVSVETPVLAASAGGATARPFETSATEFAGRKLALRIAPELWLKKLIIGGMGRVYEIGPSFRNEGLDKTHNPEFTTCEFYAVSYDIVELMSETEKLFGFIIESLFKTNAGIDESFKNLAAPSSETAKLDWLPQWPSIDFIPALNKALELELPDLASPSASEEILAIFNGKGLPLPSVPTLPRLLDKLSSIYLEPSCHEPTWIINTPEVLSPLAKSFSHPELPHQRVAARAELFIRNKEVVNCYEEENSPVEQRRKFIDQQRHAHLKKEIDLEAMKIDEDYLRALEWGLPPLGGWGCGIDRLVLTLLQKDKISDVLSFGNLRMVTHGAEKREKATEVEEERAQG